MDPHPHFETDRHPLPLARVAPTGLALACAITTLALSACVADEAAEPASDIPDDGTAEPAATAGALLTRSDEETCQVVTGPLHVDVPRVLLRGRFTVNGGDPLANPAQTATIELRNPRLGVVELGQLHEGFYSRYLIPGQYDLVYRHSAGLQVPANSESVLRADVVVDRSGVLDVNVEQIRIQGAITIGGAPAPLSAYENGRVRLRDRTTGAAFNVGVSRDRQYVALVLPGRYDVLWSRLTGGSIVPRNGNAIIAEDEVVVAPRTLDVNVPRVTRTGKLFVGGALAPQSSYENGTVSLRDPRTGDVIPIAETRERVYTTVLVPGTYDALYSHKIGDRIVPRNLDARFATGLAFTGNGALTLDVPVVTLRGAFTLDGGAFPQSAYNRARLWLVGAVGGKVELGISNEDSYEVKVVPGTYDVVYDGINTTGVVPANEWQVIDTGRVVPAVVQEGQLGPIINIDVSSGLLQAVVDIWGQDPPQSQYERGNIVARASAGAPPALVLDTRDVEGTVRLLTGEYTLHYQLGMGDAIVPTNSDARVAEGSASMFVIPTLVSLRPGNLTPAFTQGGVGFPQVAGQDALIALRNPRSGDRVELGNTSIAPVDVRALPGTYDVIYDHISGDSLVGNNSATLGCVTFAPPPPPPPGDVTQ